MNGNRDRARIIAPPPVLGLLCIGLAFLARHFMPLRLFGLTTMFHVLIGIGLIALAAATVISARRIFIAHGTHPSPYRPTNAVVVKGVYRFSRNPIYIAFLLVVTAFAFIANSIWFLVAAVLLFFVLHFGVVIPEEGYLSAKFGDSYLAYCQQVRRWI